MKVAYNACYGGFGLSPLAEHKLAAKKGVTLTWYVENSNPKEFIKLIGPPESSAFNIQPFTKDYGARFKEYDEGSYYYPKFDNDDARCDPDLIAVIEELGDKASGMFSKIKIEEIPDGAEYEIDEYDGYEKVVPPRQSW